MKKVMMAFSAALVLFSCGENTNAYKELQAKLDSVTRINDSYEADLAETDSLVANVLTNFQDISTAEKMIDVNPRGEMSQTQKERIKNNVTLINDKLRASTEALDALTQKLAAGGTENKRLRHTIAALKKDLEVQRQRIIALTEELQRKDLAIGALDSIVTTLGQDVERLNETTAKQASTLATQDKEMHTVRYCVGTKSDLKDFKLLQGGRLVTDGADLSYFTTADQRKLSQIPLYSRDAKILTTHPASSYVLIADGDKNLTLNIKDHKAFWSASRMLVIQVH
jgi:putative lipoprotein